jgi:hypothetical protein
VRIVEGGKIDFFLVVFSTALGFFWRKVRMPAHVSSHCPAACLGAGNRLIVLCARVRARCSSSSVLDLIAFVLHSNSFDCFGVDSRGNLHV